MTWTDRAIVALRRELQGATTRQYRGWLSKRIALLHRRRWWHRHPKRLAARAVKPCWKGA